MYIKDLPEGITKVVIVYREATDSFIGRLDDDRLISFGYEPVNGKKVQVNDRVVIIKNSQANRYTFMDITKFTRLQNPRASS
jgi:hypothetical protein